VTVTVDVRDGDPLDIEVLGRIDRAVDEQSVTGECSGGSLSSLY